mmetsp:Transcript_56529/g.89772  ORF Transcript_56529/g.89772 Transcript_56529/m.89772 type:complete len:177 (-) Transcript_56529:127-657(-)
MGGSSSMPRTCACSLMPSLWNEEKPTVHPMLDSHKDLPGLLRAHQVPTIPRQKSQQYPSQRQKGAVDLNGSWLLFDAEGDGHGRCARSRGTRIDIKCDGNNVCIDGAYLTVGSPPNHFGVSATWKRKGTVLSVISSAGKTDYFKDGGHLTVETEHAGHRQILTERFLPDRGYSWFS